MSAFRLRKEAKAWFKEISDKNNLSIDFDLYYFCLMAGLAVNIRKDDFLVSDTSELVEYFPGRYKEKSRIIVSIFLSRQLSSHGVDLTDKKAAHTYISRLISPESQSLLSDEGMKQLNAYAYRGFEELITWFSVKPHTLESFLRIFSQKITEKIKDFNL
jgi:hypothetical protein